jgi:hypothetical protein
MWWTVHGFRGSYFPYLGTQIKDAFEALRSRVTAGSDPDALSRRPPSGSQPVIAELTWNTFRSHAVLEYEIAKFEGDLAHPGVYFPLSPAVDRKVETLMECFPSQRQRQWFDADLFRAQLRLRGVECNAPSRYAEAFHARKLIL